MEAICAIEVAGLVDEAVTHQSPELLGDLRAKTDRQLAEYVRGKLNLAVSLACLAEQERRGGHRASAEEYRRKWEATIAEVGRLLPWVKQGCKALVETANAKPAHSRVRPR